MTRPLTEDDLLEFKRLVRWLTGATLTQLDAAKELADLRARYTAPDGFVADDADSASSFLADAL
jgi:hypothetical protein